VVTLLFPDNTVLVNFAIMGRVDLFADLVDGRGAWTSTIAGECAKSAQISGLESLARMPQILGDPIMPSRSERIDTFALRTRLASPGDHDAKHLGEAEAIAIISARNIAAVFVTDDRAAAVLASSAHIKTYSTADLVKLAVRAKRIDVDTGWDLLSLLHSRNRRVPGIPATRKSYDRWV
jgi:predicted nucleic acid-binding protein